jgi:hypothetical protein
MASVPISQLPAGSAPTGTEVFPAVQSGTTVKLTIDECLALGIPQSVFNSLLAGSPPYEETAAETAAGVTPINFQYPPGYADRYGTNTVPGTTNMTAAIQDAVNVAAQSGGGGVAYLLGESYLITSSIIIPTGVRLQGTIPGGGSYGGAGSSEIYVDSVITGIKFFSGNTSQPVSFASISDVSVVLGSSGNGATAIEMYATYECTVNNVQVSAPGAGVAWAVGLLISGGNGIGNFGNNVIGGYFVQCQVCVKFTADTSQGSPTQPTNTTFTGVNLFGTGASGSTTSIMVQFATNGAGQASTFTGGFWENYQYGAYFNASAKTTWSVLFNNPYLNGASNSGYDVFLSASGYDEYIAWAGTCNPAQGKPTCNLAIPGNSILFLTGGVNGVALSDGYSDISSVAVGHSASLQAVTAASLKNTAIGGGTSGVSPVGPLSALTSGAQNTAVGYEALSTITTEDSNTAVGVAALSGASMAGAQCTAVGVSAGSTNTTGNDNTAIGYNAQAGTSGSTNTAVGYDAATSQTGGNCTCLGNGAASSTSSVANEITLGNSSVSALRCEVTTITALSDRRDKDEIEPLPWAWGLGLILSLSPVRFRWNRRDGSKIGMRDQGFIAQDLQQAQIKHEAQELNLVYEENPDRLEATPGRLIPSITLSIQQLALLLGANIILSLVAIVIALVK